MPDSKTSPLYFLYNDRPDIISDGAAQEFIRQVKAEVGWGYGFVPFIGAGLSAPSGIPLIWEIETYLQCCIARALGLISPRLPPWNPRTDQWPPFTAQRDEFPTSSWTSQLQFAIESRRQKDPWDPDLRVLQEAQGAIAEWRTALLFLSRVTQERRGTGRQERDYFVLDGPRQEVIDAGLREIMKGKTPTLGHRMLATLGGLLRLDILLTTNFDDLLEQAFEVARNPLTAFGLHLASDLPPYAALASQRSLVKLHGDRHSMRADYTLDAAPPELDRFHFLEYLVSASGHGDLLKQRMHPDQIQPLSPSNHLLVMGFSANERRTRSFIEHAWTHLHEKFSVFWLCHTVRDVERVQSFTTDVATRQLSAKRPWNPMRSRILRHTHLGLLFLQLYETVRRSIPLTGVIFPSASRLAIPPIFEHDDPPSGDQSARQLRKEQEGEKQKALDRVRARIKQFHSPAFARHRLLVLTSDPKYHGVTSVGSELFERLQDEFCCVWLEMNDISSTDDLFEQLLDATYYRLGTESWMPVFVPPDEQSRANEIRRLVQATTRPWIFFLNAREQPGSNNEAKDMAGTSVGHDCVQATGPAAGIDSATPLPMADSELPYPDNGWLDCHKPQEEGDDESGCVKPFVRLLSTLTEAGHDGPSVSVVLLTRSTEAPYKRRSRDCGPTRGAEQENVGKSVRENPGSQTPGKPGNNSDDGAENELWAGSIVNTEIERAGLIDRVDELEATCVPYGDNTVKRDTVEWLVVDWPPSQPPNGANVGQRPTPRPTHEIVRRRRFLLALLLMQRTRFLSSIWSSAFVSSDPEANRQAAKKGEEAAEEEKDEMLQWITQLERCCLVRRKYGGFIWLRALSRTHLRKVFQSRQEFNNYCEDKDKAAQLHGYDLSQLKTWDVEKEIPDVHWKLALWYRRVLLATDTPGAVFEAVYHSCKAAEMRLRDSDPPGGAQVVECIDWASALLRSNEFMIQTRGYSRGSCRRLDGIRYEYVAAINDALQKAVKDSRLTPEEGRRVEFSLRKLRIIATEIMRAVAREVGETAKAYIRHRELRWMSNPNSALGARAKEWETTIEELGRSLLPQPTDGTPDGASPVGPCAGWLRYWRWSGMLGIALRSYESAQSAFAHALASAARCEPIAPPASLKETLSGLWRGGAGQGSSLKWCHDALSQFLTNYRTQKHEILGCRYSDPDAICLEVLRTAEQFIDCEMLKLSIRRRRHDRCIPHTDEASAEALRALLGTAMELADIVVAKDQSASAPHGALAMWCKSRLLLHSSICSSTLSDRPADAMMILTDAEACLGSVDVRRHGTDRALVELHRAEVRLNEAFRSKVVKVVPDSGPEILFGQLVTQTSHLMRENLTLRTLQGDNLRRELFAKIGQRDRELGRRQAEDPFQNVKAVVRDAVRFLDRAESLLANRRRNVGWTTWYFQRRLEAIALSLWASVLDEGAPVPFLGLSAAPTGSQTVADDALHQSLRIIRLDTYRLATIIEAYGSCALALHVRLLCDRRVPRLIGRQDAMRQQLVAALDILKLMGRERMETAKKAAERSRRSEEEKEKLSKPTEMDEHTRFYISGGEETVEGTKKRVDGVVQRTEKLVEMLQHPVR
jgi:hypothetical protein